MANVTKGAQGPTSTAATVRGYMKNSPLVNHAVMYPSSGTTSKNLPVGGNLNIGGGLGKSMGKIAGKGMGK